MDARGHDQPRRRRNRRGGAKWHCARSGRHSWPPSLRARQVQWLAIQGGDDAARARRHAGLEGSLGGHAAQRRQGRPLMVCAPPRPSHARCQKSTHRRVPVCLRRAVCVWVGVGTNSRDWGWSPQTAVSPGCQSGVRVGERCGTACEGPSHPPWCWLEVDRCMCGVCPSTTCAAA